MSISGIIGLFVIFSLTGGISLYIVARSLKFERVTFISSFIVSSFCALIFLTLAVALEFLYPGPYPMVACHIQERHLFKIDLLCFIIATVSLYIIIHYRYKANFLKSLLCIFLSYGLSGIFTSGIFYLVDLFY